MADYKDTVNLPKTDFPMKANLPVEEPKMLLHWEQNGLYQKMRQTAASRTKFIMHDGPPYANGDIHIGHALDKILKDIVVKAKTLSGFDAPFVPGWDCHGLPIELNVEKKSGKVGQKITAPAFRAACRAYAQTQIEKQRKDFIRLGVFGDWENYYSTMNPLFEADTIRALAKLVQNGHVYRGHKPVHWCLDCASSLAEAEVEYQDKTSPSIEVFFKAVDAVTFGQKFKTDTTLLDFPVGFAVWTTTPWTLPANQAVALHAQVNYQLLKISLNQKTIGIVVAEPLVESILLRFAVREHTILGECLGQDLEWVKLEHPFYDRIVPVVLGEHVTIDVGTGAVHTAPAHGQEDYEVAMRYQLPIHNPVLENGCYLDQTPLFAGLHVFKANQPVIDALKNQGTLLFESTLQHSYPHCWRHKSPVIFRTTSQWFISMDKQGLRQKALASVKNVTWIPTWGEARISGMISDRPDWCISRQRTWGVPLPFFVHKETGDLHPNTVEWMEEIAKRVEKEGIEAWHSLSPETLLKEDSVLYEKSNHILDVWFDSGITHEAVLKANPQLAFPADLYLEGSDQHRGWFQSSLLTSMGLSGKAPYRTVLTHGYTVDAAGRKMSKSQGNVVSPESVLQKFGADILRLWAASSDYCGKEIAVSTEILERIADSYRRIRNTIRYCLGNLWGLKKDDLLPSEKLLPLDRWAIDTVKLLQTSVIEAYDHYHFHMVYQKVHHFCSIDMGSCYLDIIKDRLYTLPITHIARQSAVTALYHIAETLTRLLAPILSFTAEEIWKHLPFYRELSVFLSGWHTNFPVQNPHAAFSSEFWEKLWLTRSLVNKALEKKRNQGIIGAGLNAEIVLYCDISLSKTLSLIGNELRFILITSEALILPLENAPNDAESTELPGLKIIVKTSPHPKCVRCWHHRESVGKTQNHPELCARCVDNITGAGEIRQFA